MYALAYAHALWQTIFMESHLNFKSDRLNFVLFDFEMLAHFGSEAVVAWSK